MFVHQYELLTEKVNKLKEKKPKSHTKKNTTKRLAAIQKLAFEIIAQDPTKPEYRQAYRVIVYAWVNDESIKRAYESKSDAYKVFAKMPESGDSPDD